MKTKKILLSFCVAGIASLLCVLAILGVLSTENTLVQAGKNCDTISINAQYDSASHQLSAVQTVEYKNRSQTPLDSVKFHIYANAYRDGALYAPIETSDAPKAYPNGKSFGNITIASIKTNSTDTEIFIEGEDSNVLSIPLSSPLAPNKSTSIIIDYTVQLANIRHRLGWTDEAVNLGNFYPVPCIYENDAWQTYPYSYNGDPFYNNLHNFDVTIMCDNDFTVASSGSLIRTSNGTHSYKATAIRDFAMVLSKNFKSITKVVNKVAINYFYLNDDNPSKSLQTAIDATSTFSKLFTAYPYSTLSVVQTPFLHGGMEYGQLVYISNETSERQEIDNVIIHEIAHQWWYGITGNKQTHTAWIDEGLAEYSTLLFYEQNPSYKINKREAIDSARTNLASYKKVVQSVGAQTNTEMNRDLNSFQSSYEYVYMTYVRGMLLFADLETIIGNGAILKALKNFAKENQFTFATQEKLVHSFERSTNNKLKVYFESYLAGT